MSPERNPHLETSVAFVSMEEEAALLIQLDHCCIEQLEEVSCPSKTKFAVFEELTISRMAIVGLPLDDYQNLRY